MDKQGLEIGGKAFNSAKCEGSGKARKEEEKETDRLDVGS